MSEIETGGPAFPFAFTDESRVSDGMTLRDYFAAKADVHIYTPVSTLQRELGRAPTNGELADYVAAIRFTEADAMLAARSKA